MHLLHIFFFQYVSFRFGFMKCFSFLWKDQEAAGFRIPRGKVLITEKEGEMWSFRQKKTLESLRVMWYIVNKEGHLLEQAPLRSCR